MTAHIGEKQMATFKHIPYQLAKQLVDFACSRNIGKIINVDGKDYQLDHISAKCSAFFRSRSVSIYYRVGRSVIRLSDHWSASKFFPRSKKMNCGLMGGGLAGYDETGEKVYKDAIRWSLANKDDRRVWCNRFGFYRHGTNISGGICGLSVLNKECSHWKKE